VYGEAVVQGPGFQCQWQVRGCSRRLLRMEKVEYVYEAALFRAYWAAVLAGSPVSDRLSTRRVHHDVIQPPHDRFVRCFQNSSWKTARVSHVGSSGTMDAHGWGRATDSTAPNRPTTFTEATDGAAAATRRVACRDAQNGQRVVSGQRLHQAVAAGVVFREEQWRGRGRWQSPRHSSSQTKHPDTPASPFNHTCRGRGRGRDRDSDNVYSGHYHSITVATEVIVCTDNPRHQAQHCRC